MYRLFLLSLLAACLPALPQDDPYARMLESRKQVTEYLQKAARKVTDRASEEIATVDSWEKLKARRLEEMRDMLGLLPWPRRTPLNAKITGTLDQGDYIVEKLAFESMPKIYVSANLYIPKQRQGRAPAVVYVCGHAYSPYGDKTAYQRHGISLAKNGYVAIILDSIQIAETFGMHHGTFSQQMFDWYARGYSPAGVEVWNAIRAIDYLETRPEVDPRRIGMTGRSGGAGMSWFTAAVDPRVKVVVPVMGISTYAANLKENTQKLHCDCMFAINAGLHDMMHQGALIAPRPLLMAHGRQDALFPVPGFTEFEEKVGALYRAYGRGEEFRNLVVESGHQDSDFLREQAIRWFDQHLWKTPSRKLDMSYQNADPKTLAVFPSGPPADALNYKVHELFLKTPAFQRHTGTASWEARRKELMEKLRTHVFPAFPKQAEPAVLTKSAQPQGDSLREAALVTEPGITVRALLRKPGKIEKPLPALLYVASDGEDAQSIRTLFGAVRGEGAVMMAVYPRGVGEVPWPRTFWRDTIRNAMHVGHTVDSMRLWDVLRAAGALRAEEGVDPARITVMGRGISGGLALYAGILDAGILQVTLMDPVSSHVEGPLFLNILRYTDLPEAAALLAPRRLNFYGRMPAAYEATKSVYELYGKAGHVFLTMSLGSVLDGRYHHGFASGL